MIGGVAPDHCLFYCLYAGMAEIHKVIPHAETE